MALTPDAQYLSEAALRLFQRRQKLEELDRQSGQGQQDLQEAIRRLGEQRTTSLQTTTEGANRQGLLYSGQLGKRLGDVETQFTRQQGDMTRDQERQQAAIAAARHAIEAGAPLEEAAASAAASDRQIQRDEDAAAANMLVTNPKTPAAAKPAAPKLAKPKPKPKPRRPQIQARRVGAPMIGAGATAWQRRVAEQRRPQARR